jgi:hypothetical protein
MSMPELLSSRGPIRFYLKKSLCLTGDRRCLSITVGSKIQPYRSHGCRIQHFDGIPGRIGDVDRARSVSMCLKRTGIQGGGGDESDVCRMVAFGHKSQTGIREPEQRPGVVLVCNRTAER